jgi:hypothetical protein
LVELFTIEGMVCLDELYFLEFVFLEIEAISKVVVVEMEDVFKGLEFNIIHCGFLS